MEFHARAECRADGALLETSFEVVQVSDAQFLLNARDLLGVECRLCRQLYQLRLESSQRLVKPSQLSGPHDLNDHVIDRLADAGQLCQVRALAYQVVDVVR